MKHLVTSNFNLMHSNTDWVFKKKKQTIIIDNNFNYYFFAIKDRQNLSKFDSFHIFIYLDNSNFEETLKKIILLKKEFKKNYNKFFFLYVIFDNSKKLDVQKFYLRKFSQLFLQFFPDSCVIGLFQLHSPVI